MKKALKLDESIPNQANKLKSIEIVTTKTIHKTAKPQITALGLSEDESLAFTTGVDGTLRVIEMNNKDVKLLNTVDVEKKGVTGLKISKNMLLMKTNSKQVCLYSLENKVVKELKTLNYDEKVITAIFHPSHEMIFVLLESGIYQLLNCKTLELELESPNLKEHCKAKIETANIHVDGILLLYSMQGSNTVNIWNLFEDSFVSSINFENSLNSSKISDINFSENGTHVLITGQNMLNLCDLRKQDAVFKDALKDITEVEEFTVVCAEYSPNGLFFAVCYSIKPKSSGRGKRSKRNDKYFINLYQQEKKALTLLKKVETDVVYKAIKFSRNNISLFAGDENRNFSVLN